MNTANVTNGVKENQERRRQWREWHEREEPVDICGFVTKTGIELQIKSKPLSTTLSLDYPDGLWNRFPKDNKQLVVDNITHIFTAHLPFLLPGNLRLNYNTGYPHSFSWASQCFMRNLPSYWYLSRKQRGRRVHPMLKTLLNTRSFFTRTKDLPPIFPSTVDERVIIPFTFGKDSFLTYWMAKEIGLHPILVCFNDPMDEGYEGYHKKILFKRFSKVVNDPIYYIDNPLGSLREPGEGWFGWELLLTSWAVLALPIAHKHKAGYLVYSNERSVNDFFYDNDGYKVLPDYEQSAQATEELSILTQALSEGEVYTTTILQGLDDLGIIGILNTKFPKFTFKYLMSCWAEAESSKTKRWCAECSKCARLYVYLTANGVNPIREAGFKDNMLTEEKRGLYNVFGDKASGTGWDAFGLNLEEQSLAFYLTYLRGNRDQLVMRFSNTSHFQFVKNNYQELIKKYFGLTPEIITPLQWKKKIDRIFETTLSDIKISLLNLDRSNAQRSTVL